MTVFRILSAIPGVPTAAPTARTSRFVRPSGNLAVHSLTSTPYLNPRSSEK
jgi:hypothetical protein